MSQRPLLDIVNDVRAFVASQKCTQIVLAKEAKCSQGTISRALANEPKRLSRTLKRLCIYANIPVDEDDEPVRLRELPSNLVHAIQGVWNGEPEHADALARVLRSVGALVRSDVRPEPIDEQGR